MWAALRYYGARRVAASIEEDCALAEYLAGHVRDAEDFELMAPVALGICCFRYLPAAARRGLEGAKSGEERERVDVGLDSLNARVLQRVQRGGAP